MVIQNNKVYSIPIKAGSENVVWSTCGNRALTTTEKIGITTEKKYMTSMK